MIIMLPGILYAQLPDETEILVSKQNNWELKRQVATQKRIDNKRAEVVKTLELHLKEAVKSGDFEGAIEIRKEIERLTQNEAVPAKTGSNKKPGIPKNDKELTKFISGTAWIFPDDRVLTLGKDGLVQKSWGKLMPVWEVRKMRLCYEGKVLTFNDDFSEMTEITKIDFKEPGKLRRSTPKD